MAEQHRCRSRGFESRYSAKKRGGELKPSWSPGAKTKILFNSVGWGVSEVTED